MLITKNSSVPGNLDRAQNARRLEAFWVRCGQWKSGIFPLVTKQYMDEVVLHGLRKELVFMERFGAAFLRATCL